jgi:hypothetical protein
MDHAQLRGKLPQVVVMLCLLFGTVRNIAIERDPSRSTYADDAICVGLCAHVSTLALAAMTNIGIFVAKTLTVSLRGRTKMISFPVSKTLLPHPEGKTVLTATVPLAMPAPQDFQPRMPAHGHAERPSTRTGASATGHVLDPDAADSVVRIFTWDCDNIAPPIGGHWDTLGGSSAPASANAPDPSAHPARGHDDVHDHTRKAQQRPPLLAARAVSGSVTSAHTVQVALMPREKVVNSRPLARVLRHRVYPVLATFTHLAFIVCEIAGWARYAGVAVPLMSLVAINWGAESTRTDRHVARLLLSMFETVFMLGCSAFYLVAGGVAMIDSPSESGWSVALHTLQGAAGATWLAFADAGEMPRFVRVEGTVFSMMNVIRWGVTELAAPRMVNPAEVCIITCSRLSLAALSALLNMAAFAAKQMYFVIFTDHLSVLTVSPQISLQAPSIDPQSASSSGPAAVRSATQTMFNSLLEMGGLASAAASKRDVDRPRGGVSGMPAAATSSIANAPATLADHEPSRVVDEIFVPTPGLVLSALAARSSSAAPVSTDAPGVSAGLAYDLDGVVAAERGLVLPDGWEALQNAGASLRGRSSVAFWYLTNDHGLARRWH